MMEETKQLNEQQKKPICFLGESLLFVSFLLFSWFVLSVIGMAGSGKTTMVQRLVSHMGLKKIPRYVINLDPAVHSLPYPVNIDIRSSVNYKQVMQEVREKRRSKSCERVLFQRFLCFLFFFFIICCSMVSVRMARS